MIIKDVKQKKFIEEFINNMIKNGSEPDIYSIKKALYDYALNHDVNDTYMELPNITSHEQSNAKEWNEMMDNIQEDLNIIYAANNKLTNTAISYGNRVISLKDKIKSDVIKLNNRIDSLKNVLLGDTVYLSKCFIFDNFLNSEFYGNKDINLPYTNSFIDLIHRRVTNQKIESNTMIDISDSIIDIRSLGAYKNFSYAGELKNIINDNSIECVDVRYSSGYNGKIGVVINVSLSDPIEMSAIGIKFDSIKVVSSVITVSDITGLNDELYEVKSNSIAEWNFTKRMVTSFKIVLIKESHDEFNETEFYTTFKLNNIYANNDMFEQSSCYVSNKIEFDEIVEAVRMDIDDLILADTSVNYMVAVDNGKDILDWRKIEKNKDLDLGLLRHQEEILNKKFSGYGELIGDSCYKIGTIKDHYNLNSLQILSGYQQFNVEVLDDPKFNDDYVLNINDYSKDKIIDTLNLDLESYNLSISKNKMIVLSSTIYCEEDSVVSTNFIRTIGEDKSILQKLVYVNNNEIKESFDNYNITFKKGKNRVTIILYVKKEDTSIEHNFNFKHISENCSSDGKMTLISIDSLKNNVREESNKYFAIDSNNNIIVKHNPFKTSRYISSIYDDDDYNYQDYTRYYISYKYLSKENYDKCLVNNVPNISIRFMAIFHSNDRSVSSQLISYTMKAR